MGKEQRKFVKAGNWYRELSIEENDIKNNIEEIGTEICKKR